MLNLLLLLLLGSVLCCITSGGGVRIANPIVAVPVDPEVLTMCPILGDFTSVLVRDGAGALCFVGGEKDGFTRTQLKADINYSHRRQTRVYPHAAILLL